jgi:hypothetical protein
VPTTWLKGRLTEGHAELTTAPEPVVSLQSYWLPHPTTFINRLVVTVGLVQARLPVHIALLNSANESVRVTNTTLKGSSDHLFFAASDAATAAYIRISTIASNGLVSLSSVLHPLPQRPFLQTLSDQFRSITGGSSATLTWDVPLLGSSSPLTIEQYRVHLYRDHTQARQLHRIRPVDKPSVLNLANQTEELSDLQPDARYHAELLPAHSYSVPCHPEPVIIQRRLVPLAHDAFHSEPTSCLGSRLDKFLYLNQPLHSTALSTKTMPPTYNLNDAPVIGAITNVSLQATITLPLEVATRYTRFLVDASRVDEPGSFIRQTCTFVPTGDPLMFNFELVGLNPAERYTVSVLVSNSVGVGFRSAESRTVDTLPGVPSAPDLTGDVEPGSTSVALVWVAPSSSNGDLVGYTFHYRPSGSSAAMTRVPIGVPEPLGHTLEGLRPGTVYEIGLSGRTEQGDGDVSELVEFTTRPASQASSANDLSENALSGVAAAVVIVIIALLVFFVIRGRRQRDYNQQVSLSSWSAAVRACMNSSTT